MSFPLAAVPLLFSVPRLFPEDCKAPGSRLGRPQGKLSSCTSNISAKIRGWSLDQAAVWEVLRVSCTFIFHPDYCSAAGLVLILDLCRGHWAGEKLLLEARPYFELSAGIEWAGGCLHPHVEELASSQGHRSISTSRATCWSCWLLKGLGKQDLVELPVSH